MCRSVQEKVLWIAFNYWCCSYMYRNVANNLLNNSKNHTLSCPVSVEHGMELKRQQVMKWSALDTDKQATRKLFGEYDVLRRLQVRVCPPRFWTLYRTTLTGGQGRCVSPNECLFSLLQLSHPLRCHLCHRLFSGTFVASLASLPSGPFSSVSSTSLASTTWLLWIMT